MSRVSGSTGTDSPPGGKSSSKSSPTSKRWQSEWTDCRANIVRFDGYLDSLRKQGFGYVSALLTIVGLVSVVSGTVLPPWSKVATLMVTQGLIVGLGYLEKNYKMLQQGASARARILEGLLNTAETETIAFYYEKKGLWKMDLILNMVFILITGALGTAILVPNSGLPICTNYPFWGIVASSAVTLVLLYSASSASRSGGFDLTASTISAKVGDPIQFTLTSLFSPTKHAVDRQGKDLHDPPTGDTNNDARILSDPGFDFGLSLSVSCRPPMKTMITSQNTADPTTPSSTASPSGRSTPPTPGDSIPAKDPPVKAQDPPKGQAVSTQYQVEAPGLGNVGELAQFDSVTWSWNTADLPEGVYRWTIQWDKSPRNSRLPAWLSRERGTGGKNWVDIVLSKDVMDSDSNGEGKGASGSDKPQTPTH